MAYQDNLVISGPIDKIFGKFGVFLEFRILSPEENFRLNFHLYPSLSVLLVIEGDQEPGLVKSLSGSGSLATRFADSYVSEVGERFHFDKPDYNEGIFVFKHVYSEKRIQDNSWLFNGLEKRIDLSSPINTLRFLFSKGLDLSFLGPKKLEKRVRYAALGSTSTEGEGGLKSDTRFYVYPDKYGIKAMLAVLTEIYGSGGFYDKEEAERVASVLGTDGAKKINNKYLISILFDISNDLPKAISDGFIVESLVLLDKKGNRITLKGEEAIEALREDKGYTVESASVRTKNPVIPKVAFLQEATLYPVISLKRQNSKEEDYYLIYDKRNVETVRSNASSIEIFFRVARSFFLVDPSAHSYTLSKSSGKEEAVRVSSKGWFGEIKETMDSEEEKWSLERIRETLVCINTGGYISPLFPKTVVKRLEDIELIRLDILGDRLVKALHEYEEDFLPPFKGVNLLEPMSRIVRRINEVFGTSWSELNIEAKLISKGSRKSKKELFLSNVEATYLAVPYGRGEIARNLSDLEVDNSKFDISTLFSTLEGFVFRDMSLGEYLTAGLWVYS